MRALQLHLLSEGSLIADYAARMGEAMSRRRAETEVRAARMEADLSIKARSEFLANMNHELRTPLNAIIGFATMLRDGADYELSEEQKRSYSEYILQSADLLLGHINTLLEVAALESGGIELKDGVVDLGAVLAGAVDGVRIRADAAGVTVERRDRCEDAFVWGDEDRLRQALDHLLQIAVKSCEKGGKALVRLRIDDDGWGEIAIRDNGAGFKPADVKEALEAFSQPDRGLNRSFSGPGVGYAVAKTFVEMQGGRFVLKSREGEGTLAVISMPPPESGASKRPDASQDPNDEASMPPALTERADDAA